MATSKTLDIIIRAKDAASGNLKRVNQSFNTFQKQIKRMPSGIISGISGEIKGLIAAAAGLVSLAETTRIIKDADQALFNFEKSVAAANKEFKNSGSIEDWNESVKSLSKELVIYSDTALRNAVSRTVDMTKRLELSKEQMEEVIKRSADLGAGKTDLEGAIERVTAALRGEAEASEYLGLTLNETYVKGWYQTHTAHQKAWKDLTDIEKAQIRYKILLEQSNAFQGRAAESANTFGGSLQVVRKEIENAIIKNKDITASMKELADVLRHNAGNIGEMASAVIKTVGYVINFAVEYRNMLLVIAGTAVAVSLVGKLVTTIKALNAAFAVLTGMQIATYIGSLRAALAAAAVQTTALSLAFKGFIAFAAAQGIVEILRLIKAIRAWRDATRELKQAQDDLAQQKAFSNEKITKKLEAISEKTGIAIRNIEEFNKLVKQGVLLYDQNSGEWVKSNKPPKPKISTAPSPASSDEQKKIAKDQARLERELADDLVEITDNKWKLLKHKAEKHYKDQVALAHGNKELLSNAEKVYNARLKEIEKARRAESEASEKARTEAILRSQSSRLKAATQTALAILEQTYSSGEVKLKEYFDRRKALIEKQHREEIAALQKLAIAEKDPNQRQAIKDQIFEKEEAHRREMIRLAQEQAAAEQKLLDHRRQAADILDSLKNRTAQPTETGLEAGFARELAEMGARHAEELERLKQLTDDKAQIEEAYRLQKLEREQLLSDQVRRIHEANLENTKTIAGGMADVFTSMYELTGKKSKEFFYLAKTAALAEAIVNVAQGVTKALAQGGIMGPVMAGMVAASGAVQIAKITAQRLATGGPVLGFSPTDTADNVPIWATAGEFMQPVSAVKYYGKGIMEAIRRKAIPRELFAGMSVPFPAMRPSYALATGGPVPSGGSSATRKTDSRQSFNIVNVIDPNLLDQYMASTAGQRTVLNVLSQNAFALKNIVFQE